MPNPTSQSTTELLHGLELHWSAYDPSRIVPSVIGQVLEAHCLSASITLRYIPATSPADVVERPGLGIAAWRVLSGQDLQCVAQALSTCHSHSPRPVSIVLLNSEFGEASAILYEAGAQLVVSQVPSLQRGLESILQRTPMPVPLATAGSHPLLSGLVDCLPWAELDGSGAD